MVEMSGMRGEIVKLTSVKRTSLLPIGLAQQVNRNILLSGRFRGGACK